MGTHLKFKYQTTAGSCYSPGSGPKVKTRAELLLTLSWGGLCGGEGVHGRENSGQTVKLEWGAWGETHYLRLGGKHGGDTHHMLHPCHLSPAAYLQLQPHPSWAQTCCFCPAGLGQAQAGATLTSLNQSSHRR